MKSYGDFYVGFKAGDHFEVPATEDVFVKSRSVKEFTLYYKQQSGLKHVVEFEENMESNVVQLRVQGRAYLKIHIHPGNQRIELLWLERLWERSL